MIKFKYILFFILLLSIDQIFMFGLPGKFDFQLDKNNNYYAIPNRGFFNRTKIEVKIDCKKETKQVQIGWVLRLSECMDEFYINSEQLPKNIFSNIFKSPLMNYHMSNIKIKYMKQNLTTYNCGDLMSIDIKSKYQPPIISGQSELKEGTRKRDAPIESSQLFTKKKRQVNKTSAANNARQLSESVNHEHFEDEPICETWQDGPYSFILQTASVNDDPYFLDIRVSLKHNNGYLSANDWPFLPFYGVMCAIYSLYAIFWLICSLCFWRDLLRIQIWIGGVIFLGLMEKAAYLAEYDGIDRNGYSFKVPMIAAEVISCLKRSLARMLVIVVSLGFGIVKPRLGATMQKVVAIGGLYFIFALVDGIFRIIERKEDTDSKGVLAGVPLVFIDVSICYWILSNLQQTMRTLRVRRNIPKLTLYRHFTNTLIFCVFSSVIFMIWSLSRHRFVDCLRDWKELWLDEAFWHILFSFILLVIIILWRPSKNSQRFAFTPLIDNDDDNEEEEGENDVFDSIKMRNKLGNVKEDSIKTVLIQSTTQNSIEEDLKWVEENVPATLAETALPALIDSEEEVINTRFEISKMD